jgi:hypothetical protein
MLLFIDFQATRVGLRHKGLCLCDSNMNSFILPVFYLLANRANELDGICLLIMWCGVYFDGVNPAMATAARWSFDLKFFVCVFNSTNYIVCPSS